MSSFELQTRTASHVLRMSHLRDSTVGSDRIDCVDKEMDTSGSSATDDGGVTVVASLRKVRI